MYNGTSAAAKLLRNDIKVVNGFTSNGVNSFRRNLDSALANWLNSNPGESGYSSPIIAIRSNCAELANYLANSGILAKADEVERLKDVARTAVDEFQRHFADE